MTVDVKPTSAKPVVSDWALPKSGRHCQREKMSCLPICRWRSRFPHPSSARRDADRAVMLTTEE